MACLETTFIIDLLRAKKEVSELKNNLDKTETSLTIAAPSIMEIWSGAILAKVSLLEKEKINELLQSLEVLFLDEKSAKEAGEIEAELLREGITVETEDIMIAAIARVHGETIVTRDAHYAHIPNLRLLKY